MWRKMNDVQSNVQHLWKLAGKLYPGDKSSRTLSNYYVSRCVAVSQYKLKLPVKRFGPEKRCGNCFSGWRENNFSTKIRKKKKLNKSQKRKYRKVIENKTGKNTQNAIMKAKNKLYGTVLEITCDSCRKTTKINTAKPMSEESAVSLNASTFSNRSRQSITPASNRVIHKTSSDWVEKKIKQRIANNAFTDSVCRGPDEKFTPNRKKKKDKFAGLSASACLAAAKEKIKKPENLLLQFLKSSSNK